MAATGAAGFYEDMVGSYLTGKTFKALLAGEAYVFDKHTHKFRSSVTDEVTGTGYTAGGVEVLGVATQLDAANSRVEITAGDVDFGQIDVTTSQLVVYIDTGSAATDRIVGVFDFPVQAPGGMNFTYRWNDDDMNPGTPGVIGYINY